MTKRLQQFNKQKMKKKKKKKELNQNKTKNINKKEMTTSFYMYVDFFLKQITHWSSKIYSQLNREDKFFSTC